MEKYRKFADGPTGVQPFVPHRPEGRRGGLTLISTALRGLVAAVRAPLALVLLLALVVVDTILCIGEKVPGIATLVFMLLRRPFLSVFSRLELFFLGFLWIERSEFREKRVVSAAASRAHQTASATTGAKSASTIVMANWSSYIDILYFEFRFSPIYIMSIADGGQNGHVVRRSFSQALMDAMFHRTHRAHTYNSATSMADLVREWPSRTIVFLCEGCTSNNLAILRFPTPSMRGFAELAVAGENVDLEILGLKYLYKRFSPAHPAGSFFTHFAQVCASHHTLRIRSIPKDLIPPASGAVGAKLDFWSEKVRTQLASATGVPCVSRDARDKWEFLQYWKDTARYKPE